jgi:hypothetical protein
VSEDGVTSVEIPSDDVTLTPLLKNPTFIHGTTTAFENQAAWKLTDATGTVISTGTFYVYSPDAGIPGPFSFQLFFDAVPVSGTGTLMVYEPSAKDGTPIHAVRIPVLFTCIKDLTESYVKIYFAKKGITENDCADVRPVIRIVCGASDNASFAIHELLKGPTQGEMSEGYSTGLPDNVAQPDIKRDSDGNVAQLTFNDSLEQGVAGSCRVSIIRAQIEKTLQIIDGAVASGTSPIISVNGRIDDVLQP